MSKAKNNKIVREPAVLMGKMLVQKVLFRELEISTILPQNAPENGEFLPASIEKNRKLLWRFQNEHPEYRGKGGLAKMVEMDDELFVYLHRGKILDCVFAVADIESIDWVSSDLYTGGRKRPMMVEVKLKIASRFDLIPEWNEADSIVLRHIEARKEEARQLKLLQERIAREEAEQLAREKREEDWSRRQNRREAILTRPKVKALTVTGNEYRCGIPVTMEERDVLPENARGILVASYDTETGVYGDLIESFTVKMNGSRKAYVGKSAIHAIPTPAPVLKKPESVSFTLTSMLIDGNYEDVLAVDSFDEVRALRAAGRREIHASYKVDGKERICFIDTNGIQDVSLRKVTKAA